MESNRYTARTAELVVQELGDELLIYDQRTDMAHCLTATAALVWRTCEGGAGHDDLVRDVAAKRPDEDAEALVLGALEALDEKGLLASRATDASGISRRQAVRRMAGLGLAAVTAPFIVSAAVPTAASAGSCSAVNESCTPTSAAPGASTCCPTLYCNTAAKCKACSGSGTTCSPSTAFQCCSGVCASSLCT